MLMPLSVIAVIPAYNESTSIAQCVSAWITALQATAPDSFQLLIVNDGSTDDTAAILDKLATTTPELHIHHQKNAGHGAAILAGYALAIAQNPDYIFQTDADTPCAPEHFKTLWSKRSESRFILARRTPRHDPPHRKLITALCSAIIALRFGAHIPDANIPFRLMRTEFLAALLPKLPKGVFAPNIFLAVLAAKQGEKLINIPIPHQPRHCGKSTLIPSRLLSAALRSLSQLWQFRP